MTVTSILSCFLKTAVISNLDPHIQSGHWCLPQIWIARSTGRMIPWNSLRGIQHTAKPGEGSYSTSHARIERPVHKCTAVQIDNSFPVELTVERILRVMNFMICDNLTQNRT